MTNSSEGPTPLGKVILAALAGFVGWQAIGVVVEAQRKQELVEAQRKQELEEAERLRSMLTPLPMIEAAPIHGFTLDHAGGRDHRDHRLDRRLRGEWPPLCPGHRRGWRGQRLRRGRAN